MTGHNGSRARQPLRGAGVGVVEDVEHIGPPSSKGAWMENRPLHVTVPPLKVKALRQDRTSRELVPQRHVGVGKSAFQCIGKAHGAEGIIMPGTDEDDVHPGMIA